MLTDSQEGHIGFVPSPHALSYNISFSHIYSFISISQKNQSARICSDQLHIDVCHFSLENYVLTLQNWRQKFLKCLEKPVKVTRKQLALCISDLSTFPFMFSRQVSFVSNYGWREQPFDRKFRLVQCELSTAAHKRRKNIEMAIFLKKGSTSQSHNNFLFGLLHRLICTRKPFARKIIKCLDIFRPSVTGIKHVS